VSATAIIPISFSAANTVITVFPSSSNSYIFVCKISGIEDGRE